MSTKGFTVHDIFQSPRGLLVVVAYPEKTYPRIGAIIKGKAGGSWKIIGIDHGKLSSLTNEYTFLDPEVYIGGLLLSSVESGEIVKGDILFLNSLDQ